MKKIPALLLTLVFAVTFLFATPMSALADFEDVPADNAKLTQATSLLSALGIIVGYEDGNFKPEKIVTRAEMAKMLISALGYGNIANDTPKFADCQKHWAKGYIALASDLGIIEGRGDGSFDPDANATYQEAAVMLLRTLGHTNESINGGKSDAYNAENFSAEAQNLGLFEPLGTITINAGANRGEAALMLEANLALDMVVINDKGLAEKTGDKLINKTAKSIAGFEVTVAELGKGHHIDLVPYLYQVLNVYVNDRGKVLYVEALNSTTYKGNPATNRGSLSNAITITLADKTTKDLTFADGRTSIPVFYNGAETSMDKAKIEACDVDMTFVLDQNKKLKGAIAEVFDAPRQITKAYINGETKFAGYTLPVDEGGEVDLSRVTVTGSATALSDIEVDDIIECAQAPDKSAIKFVVTRETVAGKVTKVSNNKYSINGKAYNLNGATVALGDVGIFFLDSRSNIAAFREKKPASYGIITDLANGVVQVDNGLTGITTYPRLKMIAMDGKTNIYDIQVILNGGGGILSAATGFDFSREGDSIVPSYAGEYSKVFDSDHVFVEYELDSNGRIAKIRKAMLQSAEMPAADFEAGAGTAILNYQNGNYSPTGLDALAKGALTIQYLAGQGNWKVLLTKDAAGTTSGWHYGLLTDFANTINANNRSVYELTMLDQAGATVRYLSAETGATIAVDKTDQNRVIRFTLDGSSCITNAQPFAGTVLEKEELTAVNAAYLEIKSDSASRYYYAEGMTVYQCAANGAASLGDIDDVSFIMGDRPVALYLNDSVEDGEVAFIVVDPKYYENVTPTTTTHYGLLLYAESLNTERTTWSLGIMDENGTRIDKQYSGSNPSALQRQVVRYTQRSGVVTSVTELDEVSGRIIDQDTISFENTDTEKYPLNNSMLIYFEDEGEGTITKLTLTDITTLSPAPDRTYLYFDGDTPVALKLVITRD